MRITVFVKALIGYIVVAALLSVLVLVFAFRIVKDYHLNTLAENLTKIAISMQADVTSLVMDGQSDSLDMKAKNLGAQIETRITVIDSAGIVLADSENDPETMENHKARKEITAALAGEVGRALRFSRTVEQEMLYVAIPIRNDAGVIGVLRVSLYASEINALLISLQQRVILITLVIIAVSLCLAIIFSRNISRPLRRLVEVSGRVARGDFEANIITRNRDEFKELSDSFNHMVSQLRTLVNDLTTEKETLDTILNTIQEGIAVMDKSGKILLYNESFRQIAQTEHISGKFFWELLRSSKIGSLIENLSAENNVLTDNIELEGKNYLCSVSFLSSSEQIVLTLYDITEFMQLSIIKKDFVVNVSHELRTPLTAIKGFVETLEDEGVEKSKRYLEIIKRHTDRLISIVQDLQQLSELEEIEKLQLEKVKIAQLMKPILKMFEPQLAGKDIRIVLHVDDVEANADPFKLEQVFINLIDNSIKYTERGQITITAEQGEAETKIVIEDTGIGIPAEHLPRIFERFYVVDKSHSRRMGGTGLGLSIVKHIIQAHHGKITMESEVGCGTKVLITLPQGP
jgi:two-component system phosphate regulon sensor histidine kinase PhoR